MRKKYIEMVLIVAPRYQLENRCVLCEADRISHTIIYLWSIRHARDTRQHGCTERTLGPEDPKLGPKSGRNTKKNEDYGSNSLR